MHGGSGDFANMVGEWIAHRNDDWSFFSISFAVWQQSVLTWDGFDHLKNVFDCAFAVVTLNEKFRYLLNFFSKLVSFEYKQPCLRNGCVFCPGIVRVQVRVKVYSCLQ